MKQFRANNNQISSKRSYSTQHLDAGNHCGSSAMSCIHTNKSVYNMF